MRIRDLRAVGALGLIWALASVIGAVTADAFSGAAAIYIPVGVATAIAVRRAYGAAIVLPAVLLGAVIIGVAAGNLSIATVVNAIANGLEVVVVAHLVAARRASRFERPIDVAWLAAATVAGVLVGAVLGTAWGVIVNGDDLLPMFRAWVSSDVLGILLIAPGASVAGFRGYGLRRFAAASAMLLASSALAFVAATPSLPGGGVTTFAAWYALLVIVLIAGIRFGLPAMAVVQAPASIAAFATLADGSPAEVLARQSLLAVLSLSLAMIAITTRRHIAQRRRSELMRDDLFHRSVAPTALVRISNGDLHDVHCISVNRAFERAFGGPGLRVLELIHVDDQQRVSQVFRSRSDERSALDVRLAAAVDTPVRLARIDAVLVSPSDVADGGAEFLLVIEVASEERHSEVQLRELARTDVLTGVLNRAAIIDEVHALLDVTAPRPVAVLFIDIDDFRSINDRFGNDVGDAVLRAIAERLVARVPGADRVGRLNGDTFVVVIAAADAQAVDSAVAHARAAIGELLRVDEHDIACSCSIGSAESVADDTVDSLMRRADNALYLQKMIRTGTRR